MGTPGGCRPLKNHVPARGSPPVPFFTGRARAWKKKRLKKSAPPLWVYSLTCLDSLLCTYCIWCLCTCSIIMDLPSQFFFQPYRAFLVCLFYLQPHANFFFFNTFINSYMYGSRAMTLRVYFPPVWSVVGSGCGRERKKCFSLLFYIYAYRSYFATFLNFPSAYARLAVCRVLGGENGGEIFFLFFS